MRAAIAYNTSGGTLAKPILSLLSQLHYQILDCVCPSSDQSRADLPDYALRGAAVL